MFYVGVDLGQAQDFTAIAVIECPDTSIRTGSRTAPEYRLRYLERPPLATRYPDVVSKVLTLIDTEPLSRRATPLIVDKTGVGAAVVDLFTAAGVRPYAITITGGTEVNKEQPCDLKVPKRELASTLVAFYQNHRLKVAEGLELAQVLVTELLNFKVKINIATGHESFAAWRESTQDDLVLAVALACWYAEQHTPVPIVRPRVNRRPSIWRDTGTRFLAADDDDIAERGPGSRLGPTKRSSTYG